MATSKNYHLEETQIKFNGEAGADVAFSMEGVTDGAGRVSAQKDLGASAKSRRYKWYAEYLGQATPTQYESVDFYMAVAPGFDATMIPGDVGNADAALGDLDQILNLDFIGSVVQEEADTTKMVGCGEIEISGRYVSIVGVNNCGATINATDSNFLFFLVPIPSQGQAT